MHGWQQDAWWVGGGRYAWVAAGDGTHIYSVTLRDFFFFAGSFGPSNGHPIGHPCGHQRVPTFKKETKLILAYCLTSPGAQEPNEPNRNTIKQ